MVSSFVTVSPDPNKFKVYSAVVVEVVSSKTSSVVDAVDSAMTSGLCSAVELVDSIMSS